MALLFGGSLPVLHDEGEEVGHGGGPEPAQGVVVEAGVQRNHLPQEVIQDVIFNAECHLSSLMYLIQDVIREGIHNDRHVRVWSIWMSFKMSF